MRHKHLTVLHEPLVAFEQIRTENNQQNLGKKSTQEDKESRFGVSCGYTEVGCSKKGLPIVPLKVKGHRKKTFITTYPLFDNGSNATFCTYNLLKQHGVGGRKCNISVATVNGVEENLGSH